VKEGRGRKSVVGAGPWLHLRKKKKKREGRKGGGKGRYPNLRCPPALTRKLRKKWNGQKRQKKKKRDRNKRRTEGRGMDVTGKRPIFEERNVEGRLNKLVGAVQKTQNRKVNSRMTEGQNGKRAKISKRNNGRPWPKALGKKTGPGDGL